MSAEAKFRARAKEVRAYLRSLQSLEDFQPGPGRKFYRAASAIAASRASAFIMIYNSVELASREAIIAIRADIETHGGEFRAVREYWQEEVLRAQFLNRLQQGTNYVGLITDVAKFMPGGFDWGNAKRDLPFPGNIDQEVLFRYVRKIGHRWKPPKRSLGGVDLLLVRQMRNDLAHGQESFEDVGSRYSTQDIIEKFDRIKAFIISFLKALERYRSRRRYLVA